MGCCVGCSLGCDEGRLTDWKKKEEKKGQWMMMGDKERKRGWVMKKEMRQICSSSIVPG